MKKKGFTLVEMLAVIALVAILALVIVPGVESVIKKMREDAYQVQVRNIIQAAKNWGAENLKKLPTTDDDFIVVTLNDLKLGGFVEGDIKDPRVKQCISNDTSVKITKNKNNYKYAIYGMIETYEDETCGKNSVSNNKLLYNEIIKSTEINNLDKMIDEEIATNPDNPDLEVQLAMMPRGLLYYGANPKNWVKINDHLFRMVRIDQDYIKAVYEKTCVGSNCTGNGYLDSKKYYGFSEDSANPITSWNDAGNKMEKNLETWYNALKIDNYTYPMNWETSYNIDIENTANGVTMIMKHDDLFSNKKIPYGITEMYETLLTMGNIVTDLSDKENFLVKKTDEFLPSMKSFKSNMISQSSEIDVILYSFAAVQDLNGNLQYEPGFCIKGVACNPTVVRPLISIRKNIKFEKGTGTEADPYVLAP